MFAKKILTAAAIATGVTLSAGFALYGNATTSRTNGASTLSKAPVSLGNPLAAATLHTRITGTPGEKMLSPRRSAYSTTFIIGVGNTLGEVLIDSGAERAEAAKATAALGKLYNPRRIKAGQEIIISFMPRLGMEKAVGLPGRFEGFSLKPDYARIIKVAKNAKGDFIANEIKRQLDRTLVTAKGNIDNSLFVAATRAGMPAVVLAQLIRIYSWDVDFQRDIRSGDKFEVMFERLRDKNGKLAHNGRILYATLRLGDKAKSVYFHSPKNGVSDYFDENGRSTRKALMRTPIDGARLSSGFGKRRHPILGYMKQHRGVDFAAARGTPIYAAGDGMIEVAGRNGAYGKYVRIRHNGEYSTAYAHMSRIKTRKGRRVRQGQIIGYVGTTGRSTGPHLHYEILRKGKRVNPLKVKMPSGRSLKSAELMRFKETVTKVDYQLAYMAKDATKNKSSILADNGR